MTTTAAGSGRRNLNRPVASGLTLITLSNVIGHGTIGGMLHMLSSMDRLNEKLARHTRS